MYTNARVHRTEQGNINYRFTCSDPARPWLVFLPGLTADHSLFNKQIPYFHAQYNTLTWDAPAHALSRPFPLTFNLRGLAAYLYQILRAEEIQKAVLIGQSFGGHIAQQFALDYPDDTAAWICIGSSPLSRQYYKSSELWTLRHARLLYKMMSWEKLYRQTIDSSAQTDYGRGLMQRMLEPYGKADFCALVSHCYRILSEAVSAAPDEPLPEIPALLLCGEKDEAGYVRRYNEAWSAQHRLVWIPDAGHCANADAPEAVNEQIAQFLQEHNL